MKVALQATGKNLYGIGAQNNSKIGIGFEIAEFDREKLKEMIESNSDNFDREKIKERMGNRRGEGGPGGMRESMTDQFKYWISVQLVSK
jgi:hypothetical protein